MKKLILGVAMMAGFAGFSLAQKVEKPAPAGTKVEARKATPPRPVKATTVTAPVSAKKPAIVKSVAVKPAVKPAASNPAPAAATQKVVLKKDGTPDKRYTTTVTKEKGPVKKDGTPDKRYKSNKKG